MYSIRAGGKKQAATNVENSGGSHAFLVFQRAGNLAADLLGNVRKIRRKSLPTPAAGGLVVDAIKSSILFDFTSNSQLPAITHPRVTVTVPTLEIFYSAFLF